MSLAGIMTVERATLTNFSPSALGRTMNNPLIFLKTQAEPQKASPRPLEWLHYQPHDINLSLPNESILKDAGPCAPICEDGKLNFDGESPTKPATNPSASYTQAKTLPDAGILPILRNSKPC